MKKLLSLLTLGLALSWCVGCTVTATTPPQAIATGYSSLDDMKLGQSIAALCSPTESSVAQEKVNYAALSPSLASCREKPYLNNLIAGCNAANSVYLAFHAGTATLAQAQVSFATAQSAQTALAANKGVGVK